MSTSPTTPYEPGAIVLASVMNPLQNAASKGKVRPVCLVRREGGLWLVVGLTTVPTYANGTPRTPVPNPSAVGLRGPGYVWGRATRISALDLYGHIGWIDAPLASIVTLVGGLSLEDGTALGLAACEHRTLGRR